LWNNADFKGRYVVHAPCNKDLLELTIKMMTEHKYKVPRLLVNCFIRHYRHNNNDLDLLCDILFVFIGRYVTDFCFVREFLEREVIPTYSMEWRRKLFSFVLGKFEAGGSTVIKDLLYVKIVQYVLIPCLQWAFERYNVDEILGEIQNPSEQPENDPNDLVYRLAHIIDQNRQVMSDGIVIVLYQLCTLLVKHAPRHVHNNDSKKHGWRLRVFMLFAWSCLTPTNRQDATLRYTGFLFISHIVQKFTINRKIVLQVFQALCGSFQYDSRELVRRAADVVTAAMPIRMDDGNHQMFINVKRVLNEEAHSLQHIQHIVSMVVRNYRSYFACRHALFKPLMNAVRRVISTPNSAMDGVVTRKLALDMCEMVIKWELLRLQKVEQLTQGLSSHDDELDSLLNDADGSRHPSQQSCNLPTGNVGGEFEDQLYKQMSKECVDEVVAMLLKFAIQSSSGVQPHQLHQATVENGKRSIGLMKQCLKSAVWGDIVTIKVGWLEKELTVPPESLVRQENQPQFAQSISQSQQALEVVINLVTIMLVRLVNVLVTKLFEKSNCSMTGMYEFEILNQFISKYLNDHFNSYVNHYTDIDRSSTCMVMNAFTALTLLRVICAQQPGYLDAMCLQSYVKVLEKAVRDHVTHVSEQGEATREKLATAEMISMALEILRPRIEAISTEAKRTICQNVLLPLIERSTFEKIIDVVLRIVSELVVTHRDEHSANPGLPLLVRLQNVVEKRYRANTELMKMFLKVVLFVFEHPLLLTSDYAEKLEDAFHWGLTAQNKSAEETTPMETDQEGGSSGEANRSTRLDVLLEDQKSLMIEAASFDFSSAVDCIVGLVFSVQEDIHFVGDMFSNLFTSLWVSMSDEERNFIGGLAMPFMTSGVHVQQAHAVHPVISIFLETFSRCIPPIHVDPCATQFISHHYHSWHRGILLLENRALCVPRMINNPAYLQQPLDPVVQQNLDVLDYLGSLYTDLAEQDQYAAVWNRRALTVDSVKVLAMQQLGDIEEALDYCEPAAISMLRRMENQFAKTSVSEAAVKEYEFLDNAYIQCTKELCRWRVLCEVARNPHVENPELLFEAAVHLPDWCLARQCRDQIIACTRPEFVIQGITYGAMLGILGDPEDVPPVPAKKLVDEVTQALVVGWRVLPPILTHAHIKLLQSMTMIREVGDVLDLKRALDAGNQNCGAVMQEMKTVIKIWRSRTYSPSDEMSFISLMYDWRSQIHTMMVQQFHEWERSGIVMPPGMNPQSILPIHSAATGQLFLARAARERGMDHVAIRTLNKLHTLITLPMMDCHQKIIDHLKTLRRMAKKPSISAQQKMDLLQEALLITEAARIEDFSRDQCCRLFYQKGSILSHLDRILWTAKHVVACGIYAAAGLDGMLKERARSIVPFNWLPWLPQLMTELQERPNSGFVPIVQRIASAYPLHILSALRSLLDPALIEQIIEAVVTNAAVPSVPDEHRNSALCKVLEKACRTRLTDVRMWNRILAGFSNLREFWAERHLRYASQLKEEILRCLYNARETRLSTAALDDRALSARSQWCAELKRTSFDGGLVHEHEVPSSSRHALPLQTEDQFIEEFRREVLEALDIRPPTGPGLLKLAESVIKWQTKMHNRLYSLPRRYPTRLSSEFLADFSSAMACIDVPSSFNANMTKQYQYVTLIARFNPYVEVVVKGGRVMKKFQIMATCVYYLQRTVFAEKTNRCQQYLQIVKTLLVKERETARRHLSVFTPTQLVVSPNAILMDCGGAYPMSLVAKKPHVFDVIRPLDVFARYGMTFGMRPDDAITMFYDHLLVPEDSPKSVMLDTYRGFIVENFIGPSILKNYILERFTDATYYYLFRKRVAQQLAVLSVLEMVVHLSPLFLDDMYIRTSTAQLAAPRYKFTLNRGPKPIVPFRLTPNFQWFLGMAIEGRDIALFTIFHSDFLWAAAAVVRCLFRRDQHLLLRPLILDEIVTDGNHDQGSSCADANGFIAKVTAETTKMATQDAYLLEEQIQCAIDCALNEENLSQMDPRWHPWF
uniref:FATC domain-containing protein n=1 Tax=Heligmosomoides polygyrus TaxID=6339 RepID=A0A8L8KAF2_HELPZ